MAEILADFSEQALVTAIEANLHETIPDMFAKLPQADFHDDPDLTWFTTDIAHPLFNGVLHAQLTADVPRRIENVKQHFQGKQLPMLWWTGPSTQPADLGKLLQAQGWIYFDDAPGMAIDLRSLDNSPAQANLHIKKVATEEDFNEWIQPIAKAFEFPKEGIEPYVTTFHKLSLDEHCRWHHYIGALDGKTVGGSSLFLGAGVAGVYNVATLPKARKQGVGTALTLAALQDARKMGYSIGILQATEMGLGIYRRLGFKEYCKFSHYIYLPNWIQRTVMRVYSWLH